MAKRVSTLYRPEDGKRLAVASLGALLGGATSGFMGCIVIYAAFPFRDQPDPDKLEQQVVQWSIISLGVGVAVHFFETTWRTSFAVASEALTRRLRTLALERLLQQEVGYFDAEVKSCPRSNSDPIAV